MGAGSWGGMVREQAKLTDECLSCVMMRSEQIHN